MVTLQNIADRAGVTRATVSMALRRTKGVSQATIERIEKIANEMGYRRNPLVAANMSNMRAGKIKRRSFQIGFLNNYENRSLMRRIPAITRFFRGAKMEAEALGYSLKEYWIGDERASAVGSYTDFLLDRGVQGIIVPRSYKEGDSLDIDWSRFALVSIGHSETEPRMHRVCNFQYHTMSLALNKAYDHGFRRIGLAMNESIDDAMNNSFLSGYQVFCSKHKDCEPLPLIPGEDEAFETFKTWYETHKPEVVIGLGREGYDFLQKMNLKIPEEVSFIRLSWMPDDNMAGVNQLDESIGAVAMEILSDNIIKNQRGLPPIPRITMTEGVWVGGPTLGKKK